MDDLQLFGTIDVNGDPRQLMLTRDRHPADEVVIHVWHRNLDIPGFAVVAALDDATPGLWRLTGKRRIDTDGTGALLPVASPEDYSGFSATLSITAATVEGPYTGPDNAAGHIRLTRPAAQRVIETKLSTWREFKTWAGTARETIGVSLFRGQGNSTWHLTTSCSRAGLTRFDLYTGELLPRFRIRAEVAMNRRFDAASSDDLSTLLGLAQHHGLPTPLLDWTTSPYIAAWFAFADALEASARDGASAPEYVRIYALDSRFYEANLPKTVRIPLVSPYVVGMEVSPLGNPRLYAQQGKFLATNVEDVESYLVAQADHLGHPVLHAVDVPSRFAAEAIEDLAFMGLTAESMTPGLDGVSRAMRHELAFRNKPARRPGKPAISATRVNESFNYGIPEPGFDPIKALVTPKSYRDVVAHLQEMNRQAREIDAWLKSGGASANDSGTAPE